MVPGRGYVGVSELDRGEIVGEGFRAADLLGGTVGLEEQFGTAEPAVILKPHRVAVGPGVVDDQDVADGERGEFAVDGEFVVVLAERADYVDYPGRRLILLADGRDVMIGPVHTRTHEVRHAGVDPHVLFVGFLEIDHPRDQETEWPGDRAAILHEDIDGIKTGGGENFLIEFLHPSAELGEIDFMVGGPIGDANAAAEIDEIDLDACLTLDEHGQFKQHLRRVQERLYVTLVRDDHGMQAEALGTQFSAALVTLQKLGAGAAELGFRGIADDRVAGPFGARVVAEANRLGHTRGVDERVD